jgi:hypothetical protein
MSLLFHEVNAWTVDHIMREPTARNALVEVPLLLFDRPLLELAEFVEVTSLDYAGQELLLVQLVGHCEGFGFGQGFVRMGGYEVYPAYQRLVAIVDGYHFS